LVKNEIGFLNVSNCLSKAMMGCFSQLPWLSIASRVFPPFNIHATTILAKIKKSISFSTRFEHITTQSQGKFTTNSTNTCLEIIPIILGLPYTHIPS